MFYLLRFVVVVPLCLPIDSLEKADTRTRGSTQFNFKHIQTRKKAAQQSFFVRTIPDWNVLHPDVKTAPSAEAFKARRQKFR